MPESHREARAERAKRVARRLADEWQDQQEATAVVSDFNNRLADGQTIWAWPTIGASFASKNCYAEILCESCGCVNTFDLRKNSRDPAISIRVALHEVKCPRCDGHGRPRMLRLFGAPVVKYPP